jgi:extradiol dioxygenase family protein
MTTTKGRTPAGSEQHRRIVRIVSVDYFAHQASIHWRDQYGNAATTTGPLKREGAA